MDGRSIEALLGRLEALEERVRVLEGDSSPTIGTDLLGAPVVLDPLDLARQAIVFWNLMAATRGLSRASTTKIGNPRAAAIRRCVKQAGGLEGWKEAMSKVAESSWLCGTTGKGTWKADIDFIVRDDKFTKLVTGGYDHDYGKQPSGSQGLAPNGRGPSLDDIRRGAIAGLEASGRLERGE